MSAGLAAVARPLISLIYGGGEFDAFAVDITASALGWMSLGMAGYALQNILSRVYFARQEGKVPLLAGGAAILANIALCRLLTDRLSVAGLALASAASATVYALLLFLPLQRRGEKVLDGAALADLAKMALAAAVMGLCAWGLSGALPPLLPAGKPGETLCLGLCALAGVVLYFLLTLALRVEETGLCVSLVKKTLKRG